MTAVPASSRLSGLESDTVDPLTSGAFYAFREMLHLHRQAILKMLARRGYQHSEVVCLPLLIGNDGISQRDLAASLHLSRPQVTRIVQALEKDGIVARRADAEDQRLTRVYVTDKGRRREREMRSFWREYLERTIGTLSETDRLEFERLLNLVSYRVSQVLEQEEQGE